METSFKTHFSLASLIHRDPIKMIHFVWDYISETNQKELKLFRNNIK